METKSFGYLCCSGTILLQMNTNKISVLVAHCAINITGGFMTEKNSRENFEVDVEAYEDYDQKPKNASKMLKLFLAFCYGKTEASKKVFVAKELSLPYNMIIHPSDVIILYGIDKFLLDDVVNGDQMTGLNLRTSKFSSQAGTLREVLDRNNNEGTDRAYPSYLVSNKQRYSHFVLLRDNMIIISGIAS